MIAPTGRRVVHPLSAIGPALAAFLNRPANRFAIGLAGLVAGLACSLGNSGAGFPAGVRGSPIGPNRRRGGPALCGRRSALTRSLCLCVPGRGEYHSQQERNGEQAR